MAKITSRLKYIQEIGVPMPEWDPPEGEHLDDEDFVHYVKPEKEKEMNDLYQTKAEPKEYGTLLAKNSAGRLVLEIRGTTIVKDFAPDEVEIVRPYTVELCNFSTGNSKHYISVPGVLARGDLVVAWNQLYRVTRIDTKSKWASVLIGRKILTEEIPRPDHEDE